MNTTTLQYSELWRLHHADPSNMEIRREIILRDNGESSDQLWPLPPKPQQKTPEIIAEEDEDEGCPDCIEMSKKLAGMAL